MPQQKDIIVHAGSIPAVPITANSGITINIAIEKGENNHGKKHGNKNSKRN